MNKLPVFFEQISTTKLAAFVFCATQTAEKLKRDKMQGKNDANKIYSEVDKKVTQAIKDLQICE
jgi:DNA-damage-inducible protein D